MHRIITLTLAIGFLFACSPKESPPETFLFPAREDVSENDCDPNFTAPLDYYLSRGDMYIYGTIESVATFETTSRYSCSRLPEYNREDCSGFVPTLTMDISVEDSTEQDIRQMDVVVGASLFLNADSSPYLDDHQRLQWTGEGRFARGQKLIALVKYSEEINAYVLIPSTQRQVLDETFTHPERGECDATPDAIRNATTWESLKRGIEGVAFSPTQETYPSFYQSFCFVNSDFCRGGAPVENRQPEARP